MPLDLISFVPFSVFACDRYSSQAGNTESIPVNQTGSLHVIGISRLTMGALNFRLSSYSDKYCNLFRGR